MNHFIRKVWSYYRAHGRSMPWRLRPSPYYVVVSEIMLQQTQVDRVRTKFASFIKRFPNWQMLAKATNESVLREWSGLGYNRRALYLKRIAETITNRGLNKGELPNTYEELLALPGIGPNTAGSILAFAFNKPVPFIETNIRTVFIHHFFADHKGKVSDTELMPLIEKALTNKTNTQNPREWYWALMDYGSYLKRTLLNPSRKSAHHTRQSPFKGSNRELRAQILRHILAQKSSRASLQVLFKTHPKSALDKNLSDLVREGFIEKSGSRYKIR